MYQVGEMLRYEEDDPLFDRLEPALKYAIRQSYNDRPWGIWTGQRDGSELLDDSELLIIVYMQEVFCQNRDSHELGGM